MHFAGYPALGQRRQLKGNPRPMNAASPPVRAGLARRANLAGLAYRAGLVYRAGQPAAPASPTVRAALT
ncbi:hypothetical protein BK140_18400 [Paenibacillus macerans]|nr:hypothetical protein BK140_18400 [Paenibacillus macerans]